MVKSILILAFLASSAHAVCDYTFSTPEDWRTGLDGALNGAYPVDVELCTGQDLMARFKEFKNNNNVPTTVHEYRNFWAFAVDYAFMDDYLRFAQTAAATAPNLAAAQALFTRTVNQAVGVDPNDPDTRYTYYMIIFRKSAMANSATIYTPYSPTWTALFNQHRNLVPCTWQNDADQCNAALVINFGPEVEFDIENTEVTQSSGCPNSDEFYGNAGHPPSTDDCREFRTYAETLEGIRNNQGGVLAVAAHVAVQQQQGIVLNLQQARAYFYVACSATWDFQGDGYVFQNDPDNEFVVRGDVPLGQIGGIYYIVLPHAFAEEPAEPAQRLHPKISLNTFRGSA